MNPSGAVLDRADAGVAAGPLADMMEFIRRHDAPIDHIRIERGGRLMFDCPFAAYDPVQPHLVYSCTKTVLGLLIGIAIDKGFLEGVDQPVADFHPSGNPLRDTMGVEDWRLRHLLTMTTAFDLDDEHTDFTVFRRPDLLDFVLGAGHSGPPGVKFKYSNGGCHLLCNALVQATGQTPLAFAQEHLFGPLGIEAARWTTNRETGNPGWSGLALRAADLSKIGRLVLNRGAWGGRQLISAQWVQASSTGHYEGGEDHVRFGYLWWVHPQYLMAQGIFGQYLFVLPQYDTTVVVYSSLSKDKMTLPRWLMNSFILPALGAPSPPDFEADQRLTALVGEAGADRPADVLVWTTPAEGQLRKGLFTRSAEPRFTFRGPPRMTNDGVTSEKQVAALKTIEGFVIKAFIADIPEGGQLSDVARKFRRALLDDGAADSADIVKNEPCLLSDGVPGYRSEIVYDSRTSGQVTAVIASAFKGKQCICVEASTPGDIADVTGIVESLRLSD